MSNVRRQSQTTEAHLLSSDSTIGKAARRARWSSCSQPDRNPNLEEAFQHETRQAIWFADSSSCCSSRRNHSANFKELGSPRVSTGLVQRLRIRGLLSTVRIRLGMGEAHLLFLLANTIHPRITTSLRDLWAMRIPEPLAPSVVQEQNS